jgi:hypothetical protein
VQRAGHPLKFKHRELVLAHGFRRELAHRPGRRGRPPIEKFANFGIKLDHGAPLYGAGEH